MYHIFIFISTAGGNSSSSANGPVTFPGPHESSSIIITQNHQKIILQILKINLPFSHTDNG